MRDAVGFASNDTERSFKRDFKVGHLKWSVRGSGRSPPQYMYKLRKGNAPGTYVLVLWTVATHFTDLHLVDIPSPQADTRRRVSEGCQHSGVGEGPSRLAVAGVDDCAMELADRVRGCERASEECTLRGRLSRINPASLNES